MIGQWLAHFRVIDKIGAGGMGVVYRAHDEQLDRDVAIKVLPASSFRDPQARARLVREARTAARLNHPHICTVHEVGESEGRAYIAMELDAALPQVYEVSANAKFIYEWDWIGAETDFRRAIQLNPNYADAHFFFSDFLISMRRFDEAAAERERALELDPLSSFCPRFGLRDCTFTRRKTTEPSSGWSEPTRSANRP